MNTKYAGFWIRVVASVIDSLVFLPFYFLISFPVYLVFGTGNQFVEDTFVGNTNTLTMYEIALMFISLAIGILYYGGMVSKYQGTVGKKLMGLIVIGENGESISFGRAVGRYFAYIPSNILYIGYIMVGCTEKKQGLHDKICKTYVVYKQTNTDESSR